MNQRLLTLLNKPVFANLHLRDLLLFFVATVLTYSFFVYAPSFRLCQSSGRVPPKNAFVGVINGKGEWIIPPRYLQVIYMRKTDTFWVKVRESDVPSLWMPDTLHWVGRNTAWKLLDRNGVELVSHLPYLAEPVCAAMTDFGASIHPDLLVVRKNWEYGYCEPDGRPITGCHYSFICDVGHGIWLAAETKKDLSDRQMPIVVLDHKGRKLLTLDETIRFGYHSANGWMECRGQDQCAYVDYRGESIRLAVNVCSPAWDASVALRSQLAFDDCAVKVFAGKIGLVDLYGNWLIQPTYNGLLCCNKDRLIAHRKQRTTEEIEKEHCEYIGTLTGYYL